MKSIMQYKLRRELGRGAYASVYVAIDTKQDIPVALKIIHRKSLDKASACLRLKREINILRLLDHPCIAKLYDVIETENLIILVLEYMPGGSLMDYISKEDKLSEEESRRIFRQLLSAVSYCHENKLVHRDLKPENILLDENKNVKLIDFGMTREFRESFLETCCGSYGYCAPEIMLGKPYQGHLGDVWSLGCILHTMLCGSLPFNEKSVVAELRVAQLGLQQGSLTDDQFEILNKMLAFDPDDRYTVQEISESKWVNCAYSTTPLKESNGNDQLIKLNQHVLEYLMAFEYKLKNSTETISFRTFKLDFDSLQTMIPSVPSLEELESKTDQKYSQSFEKKEGSERRKSEILVANASLADKTEAKEFKSLPEKTTVKPMHIFKNLGIK